MSEIVEIALSKSDLVHIRFAHSPVQELLASLLVLRHPSRHQIYRSWRDGVQAEVRGSRVSLLTAILPGDSIPYEFLAPRPTRSWSVLTEELATIATTPAATVRRQIEDAHPDGTIPSAVQNLYDDPPACLPIIAQQMAAYWRRAIEPVWPRLRALCAADVAHRMEHFVTGGLTLVLSNLHADVSFDGDVLRMIHRPSTVNRVADAYGAGVLLVPCAFSWPALHLSGSESGRLALRYPPRGVANLGRKTEADTGAGLHALMGRTRSTLLATLGLPATTSGLASRLKLSPAAVSQHLQILKGARLVETHRRGREVLYQRTPMASALLATAYPDDSGRG
jgi:DNA-binding transcriptional ArsR family regulator